MGGTPFGVVNNSVEPEAAPTKPFLNGSSVDGANKVMPGMCAGTQGALPKQLLDGTCGPLIETNELFD